MSSAKDLSMPETMGFWAKTQCSCIFPLALRFLVEPLLQTMKGAGLLRNFAFFLGLLKKFCRSKFLVIGVKRGKSPGTREKAGTLKLEFGDSEERVRGFQIVGLLACIKIGLRGARRGLAEKFKMKNSVCRCTLLDRPWNRRRRQTANQDRAARS
jgi:hypothetical protein